MVETSLEPEKNNKIRTQKKVFCMYVRCTFSSNHNIHKFHVAFVFGLQTLELKHYSKIYQSKSLKPNNKGNTNFKIVVI